MLRFCIIGYAAAKMTSNGHLSIGPAASIGIATSEDEIRTLAKAKLFDTFPPSEGWAGHTYVINDVTEDVISFALEVSRAT
jgi:hypothetical protein